MDENKNNTPYIAEKNAPINDLYSEFASTKTQTKTVFLDGGKARKFSKKNCKCLTLDSKVRALAIKFYGEQLVNGWTYTCNVICHTDKKDFQVLAICHDRDTYAEGGRFWKPALEKPHYHIILRCCNSKKTIRVKTVLNALGIRYRKDLDDELWANHGVETIGKSFSGYATYLTHETEAAIREGKERYAMEELVSNLTIEEINQVRDGYMRVSEDSQKPLTQDWVELDKIAFNLGYELKDFNEWYNALSFMVRSNAKIKTIRESYNRGVDARIEKQSEILRLCIYIQGKPNSGKTYGCKQTLSDKRIHAVEGGGTGKFDSLRADHEAIIISDDVCPNLLNMTDNYICRAYRRQSNNPAWAGQYFIVTSNLPFMQWLEKCGINICSNHFSAMRSRFYVCEIKSKDDGTNYLSLCSISDRGSVEEQKKRWDMFVDFKKKFDSIIANYKPSENTLNYRAMINDLYN